MRQICLDTETTGLNADKDDRIVEIGCAEIVGRTLSDRPEAFFHRYINPERDVPIEAVDVHGLDNAFLADKPIFADIVDDFLKFIEGAHHPQRKLRRGLSQYGARPSGQGAY